MVVNPHARTALRYHCRLAVETLQPRFHWRDAGFSYQLTVNSGYE